MNMGRVEFKADFVKIALAKKNQITLELPEGMQIEKIVEIAKLRGQRVNVLFGDPQASMEDYGVEVESPHTGAKVTIVDGNVEKVEPAGEQDELTWDVEGQEPEEDAYDHAAADEDGEDGEDEQTEDEGSEEPQEGSGELSEAKVEKEVLEAFILDRRPHFDDIAYDFPTLLERKRSGETWKKIAWSIGENSSVLGRVWGDYKKRVQKQMEA